MHNEIIRSDLRAPGKCCVMAGVMFGCSGASLAAAPALQQESVLEEIVVTAQKRSQLLQDVPAAVTALSGESIERLQAQTFADYVLRVPGFNMISGRTGQGQLILRGLTTGGDQATATVATYLDESPIGSSIAHSQSSVLAPDLDPYDLERIEVLRGPQGTLYGVNSLGGLLKYVTRAPDLDNFEGSVRVSASSIDGGSSGGGARGMLNVPLVEGQLAARLSGFKRKDPGFIDDAGRGISDTNEVDAEGARLQLLWSPNDAFSIRLSALMQDLENTGYNGEFIDVRTFQPLFGDLQQRGGSPTTIRNEHRMYNVLADWKLGAADLVSSTSYSTLESDQHLDVTFGFGELLGEAFDIPTLGVTQPFTPHQRKFTQEFRLTSQGERSWDWQVGAFYMHEAARYHQGMSFFDTATGESIDVGAVVFDAQLLSDYDEYAAFGNVTYHFTPRFDVLIGSRYSTNHQTYTLVKDGLIVTGNSGAPQTTFGTSGEDNVTFLFAPRYEISDDITAYARIASGYRPGAPNSVTVFTAQFARPTYSSDRVVNYEIGMKGVFFAEVLSLDLAAFYIDWSDIQLTGQRANIRFGANGGQAKSEGIELAAVYAPVRALRISANASYTNARLTEDTDPGVFGLRGERLPFVPEVAANLSADYDWEFGSKWSAYVGASYHYTDERLSDLRSEETSHPRVKLPAYDQIDLRAGIGFAGWSLDFFVKNVTDERGMDTVESATADEASFIYIAGVIQPRTLGMSLSTRF